MSIELPVATRHRHDMTEKLLKARLNPNTHTRAFFQMTNTGESEREELNKSVIGSDITSATSLRTLLLIWSGPHAFPVSNAFNIMQIFSFFNNYRGQ